MKIFLIVLSWACFIPSIIMAQADRFNLTVTVMDIRNNKGLVGIKLLDKKKNVVSGKYVPIRNETASIVFSNLSSGRYAVNIFHDENQNGQMDYNWLKLPKEGFGFSGETKKLLGAPKYEEMLFFIISDDTVTVTMHYVL
ncbi:MAG: DUF2141 domain-containing protein [Bacteroidales bacterium]|nr:DUF2141 domain-containing protein [Bacteroidales bacterium]